MGIRNGLTNGTTLPHGSSPSLKLVPGTPEQARECWSLNGDEWKGPLSKEAYFRREQHLASQSLNQHGGVTYWILVDGNDNNPNPTILSSCETYRKKAFVARKDRPGEIEEIISHGIGSVFCRNDFRGKGYAGRMMEELAKTLKTWQQKPGEQALFNVLYSDIGKKFYAKRGWVPFPSSHISLPAATAAPDSSLPQTTSLSAKDLSSLCEADFAQLRRSMSVFKDTDAKVKIAFAPELDLIQWVHSREEFVSREVFKREPEIKGAIVGTEPGKRVWCLWTRVFDKNAVNTTLHVIRLVVEDWQGSLSQEHANGTNDTPSASAGRSRDAIAACLRAAQLEAANWNISHIEIWNPASETLEAARRLHVDVKVVDRQDESIASLLWYGSEVTPSELEWVANEKYGWC